MDTLTVASRFSEHWLTIMTCTVCERTPDSSPLFKCSLGHMICRPCFENLSRSGMPRCKKCNSTRWRQTQVSKDFLRKLKAKPGIGRPRRYQLVNLVNSCTESCESDSEEMRDDTLTLEKLFHLNTDQVKRLFEKTAMEKSKTKPRLKGKPPEVSKSASEMLCITKFVTGNGDDMTVDTDITNFPLPKSTNSAINLVSKKPITCPHSACNKVVTISSFYQHFKHEHTDIPIFTLQRSKELHLIHDVRVIEFNTTYCMALIKVYELYNINSTCPSKVTTVTERFNQKVPMGTFWLMVSGSVEEKKSKSYVLYWLMTNTDERFACTLEMSSAAENITASTFCSANTLFDSHIVPEIANRLNCLYLCYASMRNLLQDGPKLHLRGARNVGTTIRHAGVIGLWASPVAGRRGLAKPGSPGMRHTGFGKLGGLINTAVQATKKSPGNGDIQWSFSQVKGTLDDDVTEADIISCVEFNHDGELLATGDKGGRVVIFQRDPASKACLPRRGEYNVYSTFQSHEPEFDYLKSLEIEEKINKIRWLRRKNQAHFLLSTNDKTIKLWKVSERDKKVEGYNTRLENGSIVDPNNVSMLRVPTIKPMELMVEASPRRIFANAHTYHINSISVNSDQETYLSADDLRINLWHLEITDQSFNIVDIKPTNMEELTEVITAAEFHPVECNLFVYSSSKGTIRLCDMRAAALCDRHAKLFEEPEDPTNRSFFSEIISSISDVKLSNSGRYMISRDYLSVKVWDLHMETKPIETYPVHEYLRSKLCSLYENDCIFDKFECCWNGNDSAIMTGSYNNFFRMFDRTTKREVTLEASRDIAKPKTVLKPRKVCTGGKRKKDEISVDCLDFNKKILHTAWHPTENIIAVAATNNLFLFQDKF